MNTDIDDLTLYHTLHVFNPVHRYPGNSIRRELAKRLGRKVSPEMMADILKTLYTKKLVMRASEDLLVKDQFVLDCMMPMHLHYWLTKEGKLLRENIRIENAANAVKKPAAKII